MQQHLKIKKQGLLLLIENYLKRQGPQDLFFMQKHIKSTSDLAASINSDLEFGLSSESMQENQYLYGSNRKKVAQTNKYQQFSKIIRSQLSRFKLYLLLLSIIIEYTCGIIWSRQQMKKGSIFIFALIVISLLLRIFLRWRSSSIILKDSYGKKVVKVNVCRDGERYQIAENDIKVGDVISIDFNEIVPASGVLISPIDITVDQNYLGRGIQQKRIIQNCFEQIYHQSQLQLKIQFQNSNLPSPILLRGCRLLLGGPFKMLVIATEETNLLDHYDKAKSQHLNKKSILEQWIADISKDLQHISEVCLIIIIVFHTLAMVFKVLGLPAGKYEYLIDNIITVIQTLIACSFLLDANILVDLLKGQYLTALALVERGEELDKLLSIEQILITDQNICKYDEVRLKKIVLCDMGEPVDIKLLPAMQQKIHYSILYEIMGGVELQDTLPHKIPNRVHKNSIIHVNNSQQKIFSSLYEHYQSISNNHPLQPGDSDSITEPLKQNKYFQKLQTEKINRIIPHLSHLSIQSNSNQCSLRLNQNSPAKKPQKQAKLQDYLNKHCQFSTQNIIEGLNKLAKNSSRTYYFQKFSLERLSKVKHIWSHCKFNEIKPQDHEKLLQGIRKLQRQNLTVYLIGIGEGAFNNQYMSYLFSAIGVELAYQSQIIQRLKSLEKIGIKSIITIFKNNFEEMNQLQRHQYEYDFLKRGWNSQNQHFCKLEDIRKNGGRKMCSICMLSHCGCRSKQEELANIQGFLQAIQQVKCIYNLTQEDIDYIQLGFEQLNLPTLRIVDRKEDTIERLNQIIICHQLMHTLQENLSFWILLLLLTFFYYFPINFITFGHIFCNEQLYFYFVYIQILLSRHNFISHSWQVDSQTKRSKNRSIKNIFGWAIKGDIIIFWLLMTATCVVILFVPTIFIHEDISEYLEKYHCVAHQSYYHHPQLKTFVCSNTQQTIILYPKLQTFIFIVTILAITLRTFVSVQKILSFVNIAVHTFLLIVLLIFIYLCPSCLHLSYHGLSTMQLSSAFAISLSIVFLAKFSRWIISTFEGGRRFQFTLNLAKAKRYNDYAEILKEYKEQKALKYSYEEQ